MMPERVLLDTNVVLDVLLNRIPHNRSSLLAFDLVVRGAIVGILCATAVPTLHFLVRKVHSAADSAKDIALLLRVFEIAPVDGRILAAAAARRGDDFEDDVVLESALAVGASVLMTRDRAGFAGAAIPVLSPEEFLARRGL